MLTTILHMPHAFFMAPPRSTLPSQLSDNRTCVGYDLTDPALFAAREAIPLSSRYLASQASAFLPIFASSASAATTATISLSPSLTPSPSTLPSVSVLGAWRFFPWAATWPPPHPHRRPNRQPGRSTGRPGPVDRWPVDRLPVPATGPPVPAAGPPVHFET